MTATNKLKARMTELGLTQAQVAAEIGMSTQTFSYKLHNKIEFKVSEIQLLCKLLKISDSNMKAYFFAH